MHFELWQHITVDGQFSHKDTFGKIRDFLSECKKTKSDPVFDLAPEGFSIQHTTAWNSISVLYQQMGFDHSNITLTTCDGSAEFDCMVQNHMMFVDWMHDYMQNKTMDNGTYTPVNFMHFVGRLSWDRVYMHHIIKTHFAEKSYFRLHGYTNSKVAQGQCFKDLLEQGFGYEESLEIVSQIQQLPQHNTGNFEKLEKNFNFPHNVEPLMEYYSNAFVDVVHETDISENNFFITEKTLRPMLFQRPFIVVGGKNFLSKLQSIGFRTFAQWWSEDYDLSFGKDRLREIQKLLHRLSHLNVDQMRSILKDMNEVLQHNYQWLKEKKYKHE